jgi:hypothetical protein
MRRTLEVARHILTHNDNFGMFNSVFISSIEVGNNVILPYHGQLMAYKPCVGDDVLGSPDHSVFLVAGRQ